MKKLLLIGTMFLTALTGGLLLAACGDETAPTGPKTPTLEKSSFCIEFITDESDTPGYQLKWTADYAIKYRLNCDGEETVTSQRKLSLNGFSADAVHTVTVTAIGEQEQESAPVSVSFKSEKLAAPYNVRLYGDTNSFGWKGPDETDVYYLLSCEELDLDVATSKPILTGKIKTIPVYENRLFLYNLRDIYEQLDLYPLESFRVRALPYHRDSYYTEDTDLIEYFLPSDFSEQSVNFYASEMSNPSNVRWNFEGLAEHPGYAFVEWDGAISNYRYLVMVKHPEGYYSGIETTDKGASQSSFGLDFNVTGDYELTVQAMCNDFDFIGEDASAKSVTYLFYLSSPVSEKLRFQVRNTVLSAPENLRIEGESILWDEVEKANGYWLELDCGEKHFSLFSESAQIPLTKIFEQAGEEGVYDLRVTAFAPDPQIARIEDGMLLLLDTYSDSEASAPLSNAIKLKAIPTVKNVQIDFDNRTITWEGVSEASGYTVGFMGEHGGHGTTTGLNTQYVWDKDENLSRYNEIYVEANCEYRVTGEDGIVTIFVSSVYRCKL